MRFLLSIILFFSIAHSFGQNNEPSIDELIQAIDKFYKGNFIDENVVRKEMFQLNDDAFLSKREEYGLEVSFSNSRLNSDIVQLLSLEDFKFYVRKADSINQINSYDITKFISAEDLLYSENSKIFTRLSVPIFDDDYTHCIIKLKFKPQYSLTYYSETFLLKRKKRKWVAELIDYSLYESIIHEELMQ